MKMRSGFVSVIGRPNAGKSTLVNALIGEKVAIVTAKPQTTRTRIHGMVEVPDRKGVHPLTQIVFVDTPGVHQGNSQLDRKMTQEIWQALQTRDLVLLVVDVVRRQAREDEAPLKLDRVSEEAMAFEMIRELDCPVFLVITKIDLVSKDRLLPLIEGLSKLHSFAEVIPVSAKNGDGLKVLLAQNRRIFTGRPKMVSKRSVHRSAGTVSGRRVNSRTHSAGYRRRGSLRLCGGRGAL